MWEKKVEKVAEEGMEEGVGERGELGKKVDWKVSWAIELGSHVLRLVLLPGELAGDLDQSFPVVTRLLGWVVAGPRRGRIYGKYCEYDYRWLATNQPQTRIAHQKQ